MAKTKTVTDEEYAAVVERLKVYDEVYEESYKEGIEKGRCEVGAAMNAGKDALRAWRNCVYQS